MRKAGPFDDSPFYEVENRRLQRAFNQQTGFVRSGQGAVTAGTGAQLVIAAYPDGALIDGLYVENPASETVTLTTNTGSTNPRIDRLVLRLDMAAKTIAPFQIVGTPAASPTAPALTRTATTFDMPLCRYTLPGSASAQNPTALVDERVYLSGAGVNASSGTLAGAEPPFGTPLVTKTHRGVLTFNGSGEVSITFPGGAFPNGVVAVHAQVNSGNPFVLVVVSATLSAVTVRGYNVSSGGVTSGLTYTLVVTAMGW